jgi:hypothetical protein
MARFNKSTEVQTVLFDKAKWTVSSAKAWLKRKGYSIPEADTTSQYHRFRQRPPFQFQKGTFRTLDLGKNTGIKAVIAVPKTSKKKNPSGDAKKAKRPWLPATLVALATPLSIDLEGGETLKFPLSGKFVLGSNKSGTELWIVSEKGGKNVRATDEKGEKLYESFTGFEHDDVAKLVQIKPRSMSRLGRAMSLTYRSDKFSRPGKNSDYVHPFQHYPTVSVDNLSQPTIVALRGGRIKVKKEGITG